MGCRMHSKRHRLYFSDMEGCNSRRLRAYTILHRTSSIHLEISPPGWWECDGCSSYTRSGGGSPQMSALDELTWRFGAKNGSFLKFCHHLRCLDILINTGKKSMTLNWVDWTTVCKYWEHILSDIEWTSNIGLNSGESFHISRMPSHPRHAQRADRDLPVPYREREREEIMLILLMLQFQKSQGQPPGTYKNPLNNKHWPGSSKGCCLILKDGV